MKPSSLALRLASVAILIPVIVAATWWYWFTVALVATCVVVGVVELCAMLRQGGHHPRLAPALCAALAFTGAAALRPFSSLDLTGFALAAALTLTLVFEIFPRDRSTSLLSWALTFTAAVYVGWLLSAFILLRQIDAPLRPAILAPLGIPPGAAWIMLVLAITWINDSAAFFVGRAFGRTQMAPILSPKKSWEGFWGGIAGAMFAAALATYLLGLPIAQWEALLLGALTGVAATLGDLGESLIKRQVGVKDSGALIPGHGGILDRMDSLLFTAPVVLYVALLTLAF
jgi:phosphatidate cytidylyltransferase